MGFKRHTGTAWQEIGSAKRYDGSVWLRSGRAKRWDGSKWVEIWTAFSNTLGQTFAFSGYTMQVKPLNIVYAPWIDKYLVFHNGSLHCLGMTILNPNGTLYKSGLEIRCLNDYYSEYIPYRISIGKNCVVLAGSWGSEEETPEIIIVQVSLTSDTDKATMTYKNVTVPHTGNAWVTCAVYSKKLDRYVIAANTSRTARFYTTPASGITSPDSWTYQEFNMSSNLTGGIYVEELGKFIIGSLASGTYVSSDGITWTKGGGASNFFVWNSGLKKLISWRHNNTAIKVSSDGLTWTDATLPVSLHCYGRTPALFTAKHRTIVIGIGTGSGSSSMKSLKAWYSDDLKNWKESVVPASNPTGITNYYQSSKPDGRICLADTDGMKHGIFALPLNGDDRDGCAFLTTK